jgi:2-keto-3-deoxy-L-rhamnonate aldolase RhmA
VASAEIMARAGFDWLAIDLEHTCLTLREAEELIRVIDLNGVSPLVRVTSNEPNQIKRVMDAGAHGIIVPMVNSIEDAKKAVAALHYPPTGSRGVGLGRAQGYGFSFRKYLDWMKNKSPVLIIQAEHRDAVRNIEAILSVEEVHGVMIGPYDLSASLGIPGEFDHPEMTKSMSQILTACQKAGKSCGLHVVEPNWTEAAAKIKAGYNFLALSVDMRILDVFTRMGVDTVRRELG